MKTITYDEIRAMKGNGSSMRLVLKYFIDKGAQIDLIYENLGEQIERYFIIRYKGLNIPVRSAKLNFYSTFNSLLAQTITTDKLKTSYILDAYGLNHPQTLCVTNNKASEKFLTENTTLVVKPLDGSHGDGITTGVNDVDKLNSAISEAQKFHPKTILQKQIQGDDYRLLFIRGKFTAAVKRVPATVIGDGNRTIRQIIEDRNQGLDKLLEDIRAGRVKDQESRGSISKTPIDEVIAFNGEAFIERVPADGETVQLLQKANVSLGGQTYDVTDEVNRQLIEDLEEFLVNIELPLCGVDVLSEDISSPPSANKSFIIELNAAPGLRLHELPAFGQSRTVCAEVAEALIDHYNGIAKTSKK